MLCQLTAIGKVVETPELKECSDGKKMLKFTVRTFESGNNWINVQIFREKAAEYYSNNLKAGDAVFVQGRYVCRNFENAEGVKQRYHSLVIDYNGIIKNITPYKVSIDDDDGDEEGLSLDNGDGVSEDPSLVDEIPF